MGGGGVDDDKFVILEVKIAHGNVCAQPAGIARGHVASKTYCIIPFSQKILSFALSFGYVFKNGLLWMGDLYFNKRDANGVKSLSCNLRFSVVRYFKFFAFLFFCFFFFFFNFSIIRF